MAVALFRVGLPDASTRLARGSTEDGPSELLEAELTIEGVLRRGAHGLSEVVRDARPKGVVPAGFRILAPIDTQEVWAAGVTYERSRDARMEESAEATVYDRVYAAERPELFFKAAAWRVRGPGESVGIRPDSAWDVPEPELALVVTADLSIAGYTIGNDMSSRTIEGENPLYLPQAKVYDGSCALGPALVPADLIVLPLELRLSVVREGAVAFDGATSTGRIRRPLLELVEYLGRALELPSGALLLTGTGVVPDAPFTLQDGDVVRIDGGPLGVLENPVATVGRAGPGVAAAGQSGRSR